MVGRGCGWSRGGKAQTPELRHEQAIYDLAVSPAGGRIATSSYDRTTKVWDSYSGALHGKPLEHDDHVYTASFSPDGSRLATGSRDRMVRLWDPYRGVQVASPIHHPEALTRVLFTSDGFHLVSGSRDGDVNCWNMEPRAVRPLLLKHDEAVPLAVFDCDEPLLLTLSQGNRARLFSLKEGRQKGLAIPTPGKMVLSGPKVNPRFADAFSAKKARSYLAKNVLPLMAAIDRSKTSAFAIDPTFTRMLIGQTDGMVWDLERGALIRRIQLTGAKVVCLDLEGGFGLAGQEDGSAVLFEVISGEGQKVVKHEEIVTSVVLDVERGQFATGSMDNTARIWSLADGQAKTPPLRHSDKASPFGITCRFRPDGGLLATGGSHDSALRLWRTSDGSPHGQPLMHDDFLTAFAFSHDGLRIATGTPTHDGAGDVTVWDVATGVKLSGIAGHPETILWLQFSQDDRFLVSSSADGTVLVSAQAPKGRFEDLPKLAEWLANRRLDEAGSFQSSLGSSGKSKEGWAPWFLEKVKERGMAPGFLPEVKRQDFGRTFASLRKALVDSPMDREIMGKLGRALRTSQWPRHQIEADLYDRLSGNKAGEKK